MKLQSIPPFSWFRRKKDEEKRKKKILLGTLIPIAIIGITLGTALPLIMCQHKESVPDFQVTNDMPDSLVFGYEQQDAIITTNLDSTYRLTFDLDGDINRSILDFGDKDDTSAHLILKQGLTSNVDAYHYGVKIVANQQGKLSRTKVFDFNLNIYAGEIGTYTIDDYTPSGLYPGYIKPTTFSANYPFYSLWQPSLTYISGVEYASATWSLEDVSSSLSGRLNISPSSGLISLDEGVSPGTYSYKIKVVLNKDGNYQPRTIVTAGIPLEIIGAWPEVTFTWNFSSANIINLVNYQLLVSTINASIDSTSILPNCQYTISYNASVFYPELPTGWGCSITTEYSSSGINTESVAFKCFDQDGTEKNFVSGTITATIEICIAWNSGAAFPRPIFHTFEQKTLSKIIS